MKALGNKNQHYVPQVYFRNFSNDGENINTYILGRKEHKLVPIWGQCSKKNFYGNKEIERSFSPIERIHAGILRKLIKDRNFKSLNSDEEKHLLMMLTLQRSRTKKSKEMSEDMSDYFIENYLKELMKNKVPHELKDSIDKAEIKWTRIHSYDLLLSFFAPMLISDLKKSLLINKTEKDFIFSDSPVIFYNPFFVNKDIFGHEGLQNAGLVIFFPLNNNICLFLYDSNFYELKNEKRDRIKILKKEDVRNINLLQIYGSDKNVYYKNSEISADIDLLMESFDSAKKLGSKIVENQFPKIKNEDGTVSQIVGFHTGEISEKLSFKFLKNKTYVPQDNIRNRMLLNNFLEGWKSIEEKIEKARKSGKKDFSLFE
jgi:hypothetical protein